MMTYKELLQVHEEDVTSTDSDSDPSLESADELEDDPIRNQGKRREKIVAEINKLLAEGKEVNLANYPPLYIVNFRGYHFFRQFFPQETRQEVRAQIHEGTFNTSQFSPAVYELAGLAFGEAIDTPEKKQNVRAAIATLNEQFHELDQQEAGVPWFGDRHAKGTQHETLSHQHYHRYVNAYEAFRKESEDKEHDCYQVFEDSTKNPYLSTADLANHAVQYALGAKSEFSAGCLRPGYVDGKPKHPKVGYVQILFHSLTGIKRKNPNPLSVLHASNKIDINSRILNERELTFKSAISAKHVVHTETVRFPSLHHDFRTKNKEIDKEAKKKLAQHFKSKYGLSSSSYHAFQKGVKAPVVDDKAKTSLIHTITEHYVKRLMNKAVEIAKSKNGFIVFLGLDGRLKLNLPTTQDVSAQRAKDSDLYEAYQESLSLFYNDDTTESDLFSDDEHPQTASSINNNNHVSVEEEAPEDAEDDVDTYFSVRP